MKKPIALLACLILCINVFPATAQNFVTPPKKPPLSFHINYKYSFSDQGAYLLKSTDDMLSRFGFFDFVREEDHDNLRSALAIGFPEKTHTVSAGVRYDLFNFLQARLSLGYGFGVLPWTSPYGGLSPNVNPRRQFQAMQEFKNIIILPEVAIDLLFKNPDDALNIVVGGNISHYQLERSYHFEAIEPTATERQFSIERRGWFFNWTVGLEWQEYIGKHFGYSLGFIFTPAFDFEPQEFEVTEFTIDGGPQAGEVGEIEYSDGFEGYKDGKIGTETIAVKNFYQIKIGLQYRL